MNKKPLYIFLDESGNLKFSNKGTKYFIMSCICKRRPFKTSHVLGQYKYDLIEYGIDHEYFHCCQDNDHVRKKVFSILKQNISMFRIDSVIVEKRKTEPFFQHQNNFYPRMLGYLLRYVINGANLTNISKIFIITDTLPVKGKKKTVKKTIKRTLKEMLPVGIKYKIMHHYSMSSYGLQIADYFTWAINRKWEFGEDTYYKEIKSGIKSEFDIFQTGRIYYY